MDSPQADSPVLLRTAQRITAGNVRLLALFVALTVSGLAFLSSQLLVSTVLDVLGSLVVLLPPVMMGLWLVGRLPLGPMPMRWHWLLGAAMGIGLTTLLVLAAGLLGLLQRPVWLGILIGFAVLGAHWLRYGGRHRQVPAPESRKPLRRGLSPWLWLLLTPFLVLAFRAASNAPGFLWSEEGFGYDVLEYHLQLPKEYFDNGRIALLRHNVYANFPANVEMLYLLAMIVHGEPRDLGTMANVVHLMLGALFVFSAWVVGRECSPTAGLIAALGAGTTGWIVYLSGLAYVEHGMLFFGMTALAALRRPVFANSERANARSWIVVAGVLAGYSCGCKYPAVAMIALPLFIAIPIFRSVSWRNRAIEMALFALGCATSFAPWLIKNYVSTGNPVFPLCNGVFRASPGGWGSEQDELWTRGHSTPVSQDGLSARVGSLWQRTLADPYQRFGPVLLLLPLALLLTRRPTRWEWGLCMVLLVQWTVWLSATHLFARFAVPILIPLTALLGRLTDSASVRLRRATTVLVALGAAWNFCFGARLSRQEALSAAPGSLFYAGRVPGYEYVGFVNEAIPESSRLLMIGESRPFYVKRPVDYTVVFNRNAFVEELRQGRSPREMVDWLRLRGYTHVLVHWAEVERLRHTYGFPAEISPTLFEDLSVAGLSLLRRFPNPQSNAPYVDLYSVPSTP